MAIEQKVQTLQIFKQFITAKSANDPVYAEIAEELVVCQFSICG